MSLAAGTLNRRARIVKRTGAVDELNQPLDDAWETVWEGYGNLLAVTGKEIVNRTDPINADVGTYSWRMRYRPQIVMGMRLVLASGVTFDIKDVSHDHGSRERTDLVLEQMP